MAVGIMAMLALLLGTATPLGAQTGDVTRYGIHGLVRDSANMPIPSATVSVYGFAGLTRTNDRGEFMLSGLMRGTRVLEVAAIGFRPRLLAVMVGDSMSEVVVVLAQPQVVVLDSMRVFADQPADMPITSRRTDRISRSELSERQIIGGTAFEAFATLRPQLFHGRPPAGASAMSEASQRAQMIARDTLTQRSVTRVVCIGTRACEIDPRLSVSINEGRPGSPDVLMTLPVRIITEMRYLLDVEAAARFGLSAGGGPVLVVYTR